MCVWVCVCVCVCVCVRACVRECILNIWEGVKLIKTQNLSQIVSLAYIYICMTYIFALYDIYIYIYRYLH